MQELRVQGPGINTTPERILEEANNEIARRATRQPQLFQIEFPKGTTIIHPNTNQKTSVRGFSFLYWLLSACDLQTTKELGTSHYLNDISIKEELAKRNSNTDPLHTRSCCI
jgi:hypothetical protein